MRQHRVEAFLGFPPLLIELSVELVDAEAETLLPRFDGNPHVIAGAKAGAALVNLEKPWRAIRRAAGLDDVRLHDLRHAFASVRTIA